MIPARLKSTRFPEKMLANILGKSMISRVVEKAMSSGASRVIVATDSEKIKTRYRIIMDCILTSEIIRPARPYLRSIRKSGADLIKSS